MIFRPESERAPLRLLLYAIAVAAGLLFAVRTFVEPRAPMGSPAGIYRLVEVGIAAVVATVALAGLAASSGRP